MHWLDCGDHPVARLRRSRNGSNMPVSDTETTGTTDLYSANMAVLFSHHFEWSPRPGLQSYSAYDPVIDRADADHLLGSAAPDTVFFSLEPIDNRLASLEDARSWPLLMTHYSVVDQYSGFLVMKKEKVARPYEYGGVSARSVTMFGQVVAVPDSQIIEASILVKPSFLGLIKRTFYKLPEINIRMTLNDGRVVEHRFIPSMSSEFMLSPYVSNTASWALTAAGLNNARVTSISLSTDNPAMYNPQIEMRFRGMKMAAQKELRERLVAQPVEKIGMPFDAGRHADCAIDFINGYLNSGAPIAVAGGVMRLSGWTAPDGKGGVGPEDAWIALTGADGRSIFYHAKPSGREDVAKFFSHPEMKPPGINLTADVSALSGDYVVRVFASDGRSASECTQTARVALH
ncbi:hypothetical protein [Paraburkholderia sp. A1RO-1]|uniref:hypothetical protein n=1 Tax=Paraburkholderia sp. A1RO-1 TaxID=3028368 RepID=UPI003B79A9BA